ncbi:MAG: class I tRNA ligase family protein, partial [Bdellovibrionales bacterium]
DLSTADQWILFKLGQVEKEVDQALTSMRFSEAALSVYSFVWFQFCDWYVEFLKPIMQGPANADKAAAQLVLSQVLNRIMRLLHPFAPFISEELYQKLPIKGAACIADVYPTVKSDRALLALGSEQAALEMDVVIDVITAIRNIRGENRIKPGLKINARIAPSDDHGQKMLLANKTIIMRLAGLETCEVSTEGSLSKCALTPIRRGGVQIDVIVPLDGLVDIDEEVKRITKNVEKLQKEHASLAKRLEDANFLKNAPEDIVEQGKAQLLELKSQIETLEASLKRLR